MKAKTWHKGVFYISYIPWDWGLGFDLNLVCPAFDVTIGPFTFALEAT